jgi:hypothetical protein
LQRYQSKILLSTMYSFNILSAVALQTLITSALAGQAIIQNHCGYEVVMIRDFEKEQHTIAAGSTHSEAMLDAGHSLKIAHNADGLWAHGITQFEYTLMPDTLWYDISLIDCTNGQDASGCPGHDGGITISASGGDCAVGSCGPGEYCPEQAYFKHDDDKATKSCKPGQNKGDVTMTLCDKKGARVKRSIAGRLEY